MRVMEEKVLIEVGRYVKFGRVCEGIFKDTGCDSFWRLCIIIESQKFGYDRWRLKLMEFDCVWSWIEFCTIRNVVPFFELFIFKHCKFGRDWREWK